MYADRHCDRTEISWKNNWNYWTNNIKYLVKDAHCKVVVIWMCCTFWMSSISSSLQTVKEKKKML